MQLLTTKTDRLTDTAHLYETDQSALCDESSDYVEPNHTMLVLPAG